MAAPLRFQLTSADLRLRVQIKAPENGKMRPIWSLGALQIILCISADREPDKCKCVCETEKNAAYP